MPDRLPAPPADPERDEAFGYRPVSGVAVAALVLAGLTAAAVIFIGLLVWRGGRPILSTGVLVLGAFGVALSFAGSRHVRRSEGTRTGFGLARTALWLSVLSLVGYGAYYAAIDFAVRQQARAEADKFLAFLAAGQPELAFRLTRDPIQQRSIPDDPKDPKTVQAIRGRFGATDLHLFLQGDLIQIFRTWPDKARINFVGPGKMDVSNGILVEMNYSIRTPEGEMDVDVWTRGVDDPNTGGRDWHILFPTTAVRPMRRFTQMGLYCKELQLVWGRSRFPEWNQALPAAPIAKVVAILRIDDNVPPAEERQNLAEEVKRPGAINQFPGSGPTRPPALPALHFDAEGVRITNLVQVNAPTLSARCPAEVTAQLKGDELVKTLFKLSGPNWQSEPLLPNEDYPAQLVKFKYEFEVISLDFHPHQPSITPAPNGS